MIDTNDRLGPGPDALAGPALGSMDAEAAFRHFMEALGLDVEDDHLRDTPARVARMYAGELFAQQPFAFTTFAADGQDMVLVKHIEFHSVCAHHFVPFTGVAHIGYIPEEKMVGLSKLARTVDHFACSPQVQERLTAQIADFLEAQLRPHGLGVILEAEHLCMALRGVQKRGTVTRTTVLRRAFLHNPQARTEFLDGVNA